MASMFRYIRVRFSAQQTGMGHGEGVDDGYLVMKCSESPHNRMPCNPVLADCGGVGMCLESAPATH